MNTYSYDRGRKSEIGSWIYVGAIHELPVSKFSQKGMIQMEELKNYVCDCAAINEDVIKSVKKKFLKEISFFNLSELFKVLGDNTRVKIMWALLQSEMCVCDIAVLLNMTHSAISHQLRILKQARLVKYRKEGKAVYYSLDDEHIEKLFTQGLEHIKEK